ncbi:alternate-type signal peptide domain-containing protein [Rhodococcus sp. NPDC056743]|uniref:alternate-type signal peptide domain-containing protein n=1 Tax=Rhodococcus sp. NPDC056743 TaxID=3345934 RepID=UPI00366B8097
MNKTTKAAIAAGSAALLLAGGAGTMAAWTASTTASAPQTITAGSMAVSQTGTGAWTWGGGNGATAGTAFNPAVDKLVPGDVVNYTATYNINLVGKNLKATLTPALGGVSGDLLPQLSVADADSTPATYTEGTHTATYTTKITFNPATTDQVGATKTASLAGGAVTLQQTITP